MSRIFWVVVNLLTWILLSTHSFASPTATVLEINSAIGPATVDYIQRGIETANKDKVQMVIIRLDTPGGLGISMRSINKAILSSTIPIITYVAPAGARAASAGTFIVYASHIAAMAPGTNIGAASPVMMGEIPSPSGDQSKQNQSISEKKGMNDAIAYIRSLAELRHRNSQWAESAVREATSLSAESAAKLNVIDILANDTDDLLQKINGRTVTLQNKTVTLQTKDISLQTIKPDWRSEFLSIITDPTIAYILLLIGIYGLFFEFANPGFIMPGVVGAISLLLALYALQLLPISYAGLALLLVGIICMIAEVSITSFGVLGVAGIVAFITGSIMLFDTNIPGFGIAWSVIVVMSIITIAFFLLIITLAVRSSRKPVMTGREALIGAEGEVLGNYPHYVSVRVQGEIWSAQCDKPLKIGQRIRVSKISNLMLTVEPVFKLENHS